MKVCKSCGKDPRTVKDAQDGSVVLNMLNFGREQVWFKCGCGGRSDYLNASERSQVTPHHVRDLRCDWCQGTGCDKCNQACEVIGCTTPYEATERHHTAPVSIFGNEAHLWPMQILCRRHHEEWHTRIGCATNKKQ